MTILWVKKEEYLELQAAESTAIPVIEPSSEEKKKLWSEVLDWYSERSSIELSRFTEADRIIDLSNVLSPVARTFERLTSMRYQAFPSINLIDGAVITGRIFVFIDGTQFRAEFLKDLAIHLQGKAWQIVSARDLESCSFLLAKMFYADFSCKDSYHGWISVPKKSLGAYRNETIAYEGTSNNHSDFLANYDFDSLTVTAHGEGSHLKLGGAVVCGQHCDDSVIVSADQKILDCGSHICKRAHEYQCETIPAYRIKASRLLLLTCIGVPLVDDTFDFDKNLLFSFLDGYARNIIAADAIVPIRDSEAKTFTRLFQASVGEQELIHHKNTSRNDHPGRYTYYMFGGPSRHDKKPEGQWLDRDATISLVEDISRQHQGLLTGVEQFSHFLAVIRLFTHDKEDCESIGEKIDDFQKKISLLRSFGVLLNEIMRKAHCSGVVDAKHLTGISRQITLFCEQIQPQLLEFIFSVNRYMPLENGFEFGVHKSEGGSHPCDLCQADVYTYMQDPGFMGGATSKIRRCIRCGLMNYWYASNPPMDYCLQRVKQSSTYSLALKIPHESGSQENPYFPGFVAFRATDKTSGKIAIQKIEKLDQSDQLIEFPMDLNSDIHSLNCLYLNNLNLWFCRKKFFHKIEKGHPCTP